MASSKGGGVGVAVGRGEHTFAPPPPVGRHTSHPFRAPEQSASRSQGVPQTGGDVGVAGGAHLLSGLQTVHPSRAPAQSEFLTQETLHAGGTSVGVGVPGRGVAVGAPVVGVGTPGGTVAVGGGASHLPPAPQTVHPSRAPAQSEGLVHATPQAGWTVVGVGVGDAVGAGLQAAKQYALLPSRAAHQSSYPLVLYQLSDLAPY